MSFSGSWVRRTWRLGEDFSFFIGGKRGEEGRREGGICFGYIANEVDHDLL